MPSVSKTMLLILLCWHFFSACKTSKPVRPIEKYDTTMMEKQLSIIQIPIKVDKKELETSINQKIGESLYEDNDLSDDDLMIRARKKEDISIEISGKSINYRVSLDLWIKKGTFLGAVEAEGQLILDFATQYKIEEDWSLSTTTEVVSYDWTKRPVLKLGIVDLPVQFIANQVLKKTRNLVASSIDIQVKKQLDLKKQVNETWRKLHQPILLSPEYRVWVIFNPEAIGLSPLKVDRDTIESTVIFKSNPMVILGEKPEFPIFQPLPNFAFQEENGNGFALFFKTEVSLLEAQKLAKTHLIGEVFSYKNQSVKIEDVELYGSSKNLIINLLLSGSYNGNVYAQGEPNYNERKNEIEIMDLDFDFSSKRFLMRSMSWLFKSNLKNKIQEELNFQLGENIELARFTIQEQLKSLKLAKGITLRGNLDGINISSVKIMPDALKVELALAGKLRVEVKGFE